VPLATTVLATLGLQLGAVYLPPMNDLLKTEPLRGAELAVTIAAASAIFVAVEIEKWSGRRKEYAWTP
jgi:Ca2+-transporting ATPase